MADFRTHLYGAAATGSLAALSVYTLGWSGPHYTLVLFLLAVAGGLLPDIDAPQSTPVRGFFSLLGVALAFAMTFPFAHRLPLMALAAIWTLVFLTVRFGIFSLFCRYTRHRGIWHSWLAALAAGLAGAALAFHVAGVGPWAAWLAGLFVTLGYLSHLLLDELASVDVQGRRLKRSLGSALKPFSLSSPGASLAMLAVVVLCAGLTPPLTPVLALASHYGLNLPDLVAQARAYGDKEGPAWLAPDPAHGAATSGGKGPRGGG